MARYVVVEFDDNGEAQNFVDMIGLNGATMRIAAMYMKPTQFCACTDYSGKSRRGEKWGLYVHEKCGKPAMGVWQHPKNLINTDNPRPLANGKTLGRSLYWGSIEPRQLPS
jgi:hypothetical protein